jgi:hypothetical protein
VWPTDALWYAQAAPELGHLGPPPGGVIEATVNGIAVPFVLPALEVLGVASVPGTLVLQAHVPLRGVSAGISPVVSLYDGRQREVALLGLRGGRPLGRYRSRAAAFGLTPGTEIAATTGATDWRGLHQTATAITIPLAQAALLGTPRGVIRILLHLALALAPLGVLLVSEWRDPAPLRSSRTESGTSHLRSIQGKRQ